MKSVIGRLAPPSNNGYTNLAVNVLHSAIKDLLGTDELLTWLDSEDCRFWVSITGINYHEFEKEVRQLDDQHSREHTEAS